VFIRKLLDCFFSNRELSYLDDLMPESKKKLDDDSKKAEEVCESYAEFIIANSIQTIIFFFKSTLETLLSKLCSNVHCCKFLYGQKM